MNRYVNTSLDSDLLPSYLSAYSSGMNLAERLDFAMKARRVASQSALSRMADVPQPTINRILKGGTTQPDTTTLQKLADALEVDLSWLLEEKGSGPGLPRGSSKRALPKDKGNVLVWDNPADLEPDEGRIWIDRFDYHFSAGNGLIQWEVREKQALPFNAAFFKAKGANPRDCKLLVLRGDSMEPWAEDKNMIMIDVTSTRILDGERYAIYFEDEPLVKQIFKEAGGGLRLHSYNYAKYPDKLIAPDKLEYIRIVGRVIYRSG